MDKANREKDMLRRMTHHYMARNMSSKARIRSLKAKLSKATKEAKEAKEQDRLLILAKASLAQHSTS